MKRLAPLLVLLFAVPTYAFAAFGIFQTYNAAAIANAALRQENFFGITGSSWTNFTGNYTPGLGNPAVATDDYYHQNGLSGFRPYDLTAPECGSAGASIAASRGRYAWPMAPDHGTGHDSVWNGSFDLRIGYSSDPGVPPSRANYIASIDGSGVAASVTAATITAKIDNGSGAAGNLLTVSAVSSGYITSGNGGNVQGSGVTTATMNGQVSGTEGGVGVYSISGAAQLIATPQTMTINQSNYGLYYDVQLVCNPDDATTPFWLYGEGAGSSIQHEMGVIKSADLITWTSPQPTHISKDFNSWSSFQRIQRIGTGNWVSKGYEVGYFLNGNVFARSTWTSTDGNTWQPGSTNLNPCVPASSQSGTTDGCTGVAQQTQFAQSPFTVTVGGTPWVIGRINSVNGSNRVGSQWVGRTSVNASQSVIDTPAPVKLNSGYTGNYPGPSYLQTVTGYVEDGIAHYYAMKGWTISDGLWFVSTQRTYSNGGACQSVPAANGTEGYFAFTAKIDNGAGASGNILTVSAISTNSIIVGSQIFGGVASNSNTFITSQLTGSAGGVGTYQLNNSFNVASTPTFFGTACGGLWQQAMDYYTEIIDSTAAAGAAPVGVKASCASSTATLDWFDALPTNTYRLYRGTTAGSQTTLVGDFTGTTATDTGMTLNAVTYYKLVYLNAGVEQKNRVVSTYCSTSTAFVNAHMTRALADGADASTCNRNGSGLSMDAFDSWLTSNGLQNNLLFATAADFCVARSASVVTKVYDMGTTRLPRGGDYTTMTSGVTYNATGVGGKPAWVNAANTDKGYYGGNRSYLNNIRRKTQITFFAAYQKPSTNQIRPFVYGQSSSSAYLEHASGTPGTINCAMYDATQQKTATAAPASATAFNTAACTFDGTNWTAYANATAGAPQTGLVIPSPDLTATDGLTGQIGSSNLTNALVSGDFGGLYGRTTGSFNSQGNLAQYSGRAQMIFDKALTAGQITSLDALVR